MLYDILYPHQKPAVKFTLENDLAALFLEQRVGKTYISVSVIEQEAKPGYSALIIVPLTNKESSWQSLINKWIPSAVIHFDLAKIDSSKISITLLHYEQAVKLRKKLKKRKWSRIIIDESQRLKARNSKQSRMANLIRHSSNKKLILSGTPIEQQPQDLWPQFRFLAPHVLGERWGDFELEFLKKSGYMGYKRKFNKDKLTQFLKLIQPYCLRVTKDKAGILESKLIKHPVDLLGKQRRLYDSIEQNLVGSWRGEPISCKLEITQNVLLQQITGGFVRTDDKNLHWVGNAKLRKMKHLLKTVDKPAVVFCKYKREMRAVKRLAERLGLKTAVIQGKNRKERPAIIKAFQSGQYDVLISQQRTGGVGVDLYAANDIIFYSIIYSFIAFEQAKARADCTGKTEAPRLHLIMAKNTIDEDIYSLILSKKSVSDKVLTRLKHRRLKNGKSRKDT